MTIEEAELFRMRFFEAYKGIAEWHEKVQQAGTKESRTIGGRRRLWNDTPKFTELLNAPVQGTSADITKKALCLIMENLKDSEYRIVGCVHDEIIVEVLEDKAKEIADAVTDCMKMAGETYLKQIPVEVEVSITDNWLEK